MMIIPTGDHIEIGDPLKERDIQIKVEGHQIEEDIPIEIEMMMEDPLMMEDSLMEMEDPWTPWWMRTTRPSRTPWASETYNSPNSLGDTGYLHLGEYI